MRISVLRVSALAGLVLLLSGLLGLARAAVPDDPFPRPPELATAISFWKDIFGRYSEHEVVFHHPDRLDVIYRVLDLREAALSFDDEDEYRLFRREQVGQVREEIQDQLRALAALSEGAAVPGPLQNLAGLMKKIRGGPDKYAQAAEWVRGQRGLREKFARAIVEAGQYMPYIERAFAEAGLPRMLTRLPYVESSFNRAAYSRSGAAGIWQFMPGTARHYMRYDEVADQRRDPWMATHAAIGHLTDDYALLQDWPLAVTAYNYGRNGLARGREATGIDSLVGLIKHWDGPRWGFAAKNYYAEFIAAIEVEQNAAQYFGPLSPMPLQTFDEVTTPAYLSYRTVQRLSGLGQEEFAWFNPSFSTAVQRGDLWVPRGSVIRTLRGRGDELVVAMSRLPADQRHDRQKAYFAEYRVRRGDALSKIAARYGTSVSAIMRSNNLRSASLIRVGQTLRVPTGRGAVAAGAVAAPEFRFHRVASGETLWAIARTYGTTVSRLLADNDIGSATRLQVGQQLKVRGGEAQRIAHRVRVGDTLSQIAERYGTSVAQLKRDNRINNANMLRLGQVLQVTVGVDGESSRAPLRHRVQPGQTLDGIARRYGLSAAALIRYNSIRNPDLIRAGDWITIPRG